MTLALILLLAGLVAAFLMLSGRADVLQGLADVETGGYVAAGLLALYVVFLLLGTGNRWRQRLGQLLVWLGVMAALVVGYSYREDVAHVANRVAGDLLPPGTALTVETGQPGEKAVRIRKRRDGHFVARTTVNNAGLSLLVDTGASAVVLKAADAQRIGIDLSDLNFSVPVSTANGTAYAAPIRLRSVAIGPIVILRRLRSFDFSGDFLTLRG